MRVDLWRRRGPDCHPETLTFANNLANTAAGQLNDAIPLYQQNLASRQRILGEDHPDTIASRNNLAAAYWRAGKLTEAISNYEQAVSANERLLGPDHPATLTSRNNLANALDSSGRHADGIRLHERALSANGNWDH